MHNPLQSEALRLVFRLDELLEPLEDCDHVSNPARAKKLRKILERASVRYYRRRQITQPSPYSMIEAILRKAAEPVVEVVESVEPDESLYNLTGGAKSSLIFPGTWGFI